MSDLISEHKAELRRQCRAIRRSSGDKIRRNASRFLHNFRGLSVGIVFHVLLLDEIPHTTLDIPMNWILTEQEVVRT